MSPATHLSDPSAQHPRPPHARLNPPRSVRPAGIAPPRNHKPPSNTARPHKSGSPPGRERQRDTPAAESSSMRPAHHMPLAAGRSSHFIQPSLAQHEQTFHCRFPTAIADAGPTFSYIFTMQAQSISYVVSRACGLGRRVGPTGRAEGSLDRPGRRPEHAGRADLPTPAGTGGEAWAGQG